MCEIREYYTYQAYLLKYLFKFTMFYNNICIIDYNCYENYSNIYIFFFY